MSNFETDVQVLEVERCMSATNYEHEVGDIVTVRVEVLRRERGCGDGGRWRRTFRFGVEAGVAAVKSVEPTNPKRSCEQGRIQVRHLAPMESEAGKAVCSAVPEVESVQSLSETLQDEQATAEEER